MNMLFTFRLVLVFICPFEYVWYELFFDKCIIIYYIVIYPYDERIIGLMTMYTSIQCFLCTYLV